MYAIRSYYARLATTRLCLMALATELGLLTVLVVRRAMVAITFFGVMGLPVLACRLSDTMVLAPAVGNAFITGANRGLDRRSLP